MGAEREVYARTLKLASNRYRAGYSAYLDQLDAERGLLFAELALVQARGPVERRRQVVSGARGRMAAPR